MTLFNYEKLNKTVKSSGLRSKEWESSHLSISLRSKMQNYLKAVSSELSSKRTSGTIKESTYYGEERIISKKPASSTEIK